MARINAKERDKKERRWRRVKKRKGIEAQRVKPPNPSREVDELIEDEEQNGRQERKKKQRVGLQPNYPGIL